MRLVRAKPADGRLFWGVLPWKVTREGMATGDPNLDMLRNVILEVDPGGQAEFSLVFPPEEARTLAQYILLVLRAEDA